MRMLENLLFSFNIVLPLMLMMFFGYFLKLINVISEDTAKKLNTLLFKGFTPLLVFSNIYNSDFRSSFSTNLLLFVILGTIIQFFISLSIVLLTVKDRDKKGVMLHAMFRSNYVIYAIPIATAIFGAEAGGMAAILMSFIIPTYNILAVIALEMFNGSTPSLLRTLKGIVTNPLIVSAVIAILFQVFNLRLPNVIIDTMGTIASATTPLAFMVLGATFAFNDVGKYIKQIFLCTSFKLVIFPLIFISLAIFLGFRNESLAVIIGTFASPVAVGSIAMAQEMGGDGKLAGLLVIFTSLFSILTIFLCIFALRSFAFI